MIWGELISFFLTALAGILIIINPLTTAFVFSAIFEKSPETRRKFIAKKAAYFGSFILIFIALVGSYVFNLFGISIEAFRIAGGLILFGIGYKMIKEGDQRHQEHALDDGKVAEGMALIPLAIPFISGPGSITTVLVLAEQAKSLYYLAAVILAILLTGLACYYAMYYSKYVVRYIGETGKAVISKLFGLIIVAISVQFVITGVVDVLKTII